MNRPEEIKVSIIEHPGKLGPQKSASLSRRLQKLLADPAFLAQVEERMERDRKAKERKTS